MNRVEKFWNRVDIDLDDKCWNWKGSIYHNSGYGRVKFKGYDTGAHRIAWMLHNEQDIPDGKFICHHCDNPLCCNPTHLFLADPVDNLIDMLRKGRGSQQVLTVDEVIKIRKLYDTGEYTHRELGEEFGVATPTIGSAVRAETWAWVS